MPSPLVSCLFFVAVVQAADSSSPINTDRPAVTASSIVVPAGSLQFENGITDTIFQGERTVDGPETLVRFGVAQKTELRLTAPDYFGAANGPSGFGALMIGVKQQFGPTPGGFGVALIVSLSLPSGARGISSGGYDPSVQLPWSRALSANWTIAGMFSVYFPTTPIGRNTTGQGTFLIQRQITKNWSAFAEYAGTFPEQGGPQNLAHFGTMFTPTPHQQLDLHVGVGLSRAAPDHFIGAGYSFRLQVFGR